MEKRTTLHVIDERAAEQARHNKSFDKVWVLAACQLTASHISPATSGCWNLGVKVVPPSDLLDA